MTEGLRLSNNRGVGLELEEVIQDARACRGRRTERDLMSVRSGLSGCCKSQQPELRSENSEVRSAELPEFGLLSEFLVLNSNFRLRFSAAC